MKNSMKRLSAASLLMLLALLLTGCTSKSNQDMEMGTYAVATTAAYEETAAATAAYEETAAAGSYESEALNDSGGEYNGLSDTAVQPQAAVPEGRKLIRTIRLHAETTTFDELLKQLNTKVAQLEGYVEQSEVYGNSMTRTGLSQKQATITVRIPSASLQSFVEEVEAGSNVTSKSETTDDVTLRYSDIESRKKSLEIEQERIWVLLEKADTLESVIILEQRLSDIRYELESYESQLRLFDNQVEYSIVYIQLNEVIPTELTPLQPEGVGTRIQNGFQKSLNNVVTFFINLFVGLVTSSPVWLPILAIIVVIIIIIKRRSRVTLTSSNTFTGEGNEVNKKLKNEK